MADREKVIKGLEQCKTVHGNCDNCPYEDDSFNFAKCTAKLCADALALLKEQDEEIKHLRLALDIVKGSCKGIVVET